MARHGCNRAGQWPVQLRFKTGLTSEEYVSREAWREATLERCPVHPHGGAALRVLAVITDPRMIAAILEHIDTHAARAPPIASA